MKILFLITHPTHRVKIMVEKFPISVESLCLRQGMATSGHWCYMILLMLLDHVTIILTRCIECVIRNYVSEVHKTFIPPKKKILLFKELEKGIFLVSEG